MEDQGSGLISGLEGDGLLFTTFLVEIVAGRWGLGFERRVDGVELETFGELKIREYLIGRFSQIDSGFDARFSKGVAGLYCCSRLQTLSARDVDVRL